MVDNIEKVLERGEKIELLVDKTDNLRFQVGSCSRVLPASCLRIAIRGDGRPHYYVGRRST